MDFVHLHMRSEYSLLQSLCRIKDVVQQAKALGYHSLAITDLHVMYGVVPFYKACIEEGLKPIIGVEFDIKNDDGDETHRLLLLAENKQGYQQLLKLSSIAHENEDRTGPYLDREALAVHVEGLLAISPFDGGEIQTLIKSEQRRRALEQAQAYQQLYGVDNYFFEIQAPKAAADQTTCQLLQRLSTKIGTRLVAAGSVSYVYEEDRNAYLCLKALKTGEHIDKRLAQEDEDQGDYLRSIKQVNDLFRDFPEAIKASVDIAARCHVTLDFGRNILPKYPVQTGRTADELLRELCEQGLQKRYEVVTPEIKQRLDYELETITAMNYSDYFLIVWDFMAFAHHSGMITGPGRGSAAGSLVAYTLRITDVDPIKYKLLFERFLNPERVSMPDIDIDFPDTRREEVLDYVSDKYGKRHVAHIITFGTLAAKASIRDIGRVLDADRSLVAKLANQIPSKPGITLRQAYQDSRDLQALLGQSNQAKQLFELALKVEGIPRHASTHAAGIVISAEPLTDVVALKQAEGRLTLTQFPMNVLEEIGLLKIDFLGLRNLSLLEQMVKLIQERCESSFMLSTLPLDDEQTFQLLSQGDTAGIFQLESKGMRKVLQDLQPTEFEDIVAVNALYRPGPLENIPHYIAGKGGQRPVTYPHPDLESILKPTYGVIIYQEQIMQIAATMAGFSLGEADLLRRAVSKKKKDLLEAEREHFTSGAVKQGYDQETAQKIYDLIVQFANYGFNRSHAVAYSLIAYQLAYIKTHEPFIFYAVLLTHSVGDMEKMTTYVYAVKQRGGTIQPPSINESDYSFRFEANQIRFGLTAIKHVGVKAIEEIIRARGETRYIDLFDFCRRVNLRLIGRRSLEALIIAGCFDEFGYHRAQCLATLDQAIQVGEQALEMNELGLEEHFEAEYVDVPPFDISELLALEKDSLGFYLSAHPLEVYADKLASTKRHGIKQLTTASAQPIRIAGLVERIKKVRTKNGETMIFMVVSDEHANMETIVFPKTYSKFKELFQEGEMLLLEGTCKGENQAVQLMITEAARLKDLPEKPTKNLYIKIEKQHEHEGVLHQLKTIIDTHPAGHTGVILYYESSKRMLRLPDEYNIDLTEQCLREIERLVGGKNIVVKE